MDRKHIEIVAATERDPARAAALLIFTKSTRLSMSPGSLDELAARVAFEPSWAERELDYMSKTIRSSWEFLDITFSIRNVSRACAQQITRTRFTPIDGDIFGSYAMQSQRVTDMTESTWHNPFDILEQGDLYDEFDRRANAAIEDYSSMVTKGAKLEDARGLLPMNLHCNLIAKYNLRNLVDLVQARSSYRAQGEFNRIAMEMRDAVVEMWPWSEVFFRPKDELAKAAMDDLRKVIRENVEGLVVASDLHKIMIALAKLDDILQGGK